ncbi:DUF2341 domain-containing protein, partial [Patescibacteria group bacterium]|nr:DUF2341 domain-containing protein [Patescibacteria group bacterium]
MTKKTTSKHYQKLSLSNIIKQFYILPLHNFANKFSYKSLFSILFILLGSIIFIYKTANSLKTISAGWWDDTWHYRKSIVVTNNTTQETNVYISITVDTSDTSKFQTDAGDLRFIQSNGQPLDYYINSGVGTTSTSVHVNFDTLVTGSQTIYYYYGNPSAENGFESSDFSTEASNYSIGSPSSEEKGNSPLAYWSFDENSGTTAYDYQKNYDATLGTGSSTPTWTTGAQPNSSQTPMGTALDFDGTNDYSSVGSTVPGLQTISFWINPDSTTESVLNLDASHNI